MKKGNILVIDDEKIFRDIYRDTLTSEGFDLKAAESGKQAIEFIEKESFDVVIIDMVMPEWDGVRTLKEIKKKNSCQDIIMSTLASDLNIMADAMKAGVCDYILKPLDREELLSTVRRLMKRQSVLFEHSKLLKESTEYFEALSIYKKCMDILSISDYDRLVDFIMDSITVETGAHSCTFWISENNSDKEWKVIGSRGLEGADKYQLSFEDVSLKESILAGIPFYPSDQKRDTFFVPLLPQGRNRGLIRLSDKSSSQDFDDKDLKVACIIAEFSQIAINNAEKVRLLVEHSFKDGDYQVYSYNFFMDSLGRQLYLSARYRRPFSVVYLKVDNIDDLTKRFGKDTVKKGMSGIVDKTITVIRDSDVMAKKGEGEFYILLTETDYFGSIMAVKRIEEGVAGAKYISDGKTSVPVDLLISSSSYPRDGDDLESLLLVLTEVAGKLKESLFYHLDLSDKGFWESVENILADRARHPCSKQEWETLGAAPPYVYSKFSSKFYEEIRELFVNELLLRPFLRGVLFLGMETISPNAGFCKKIANAKNLATRVFVLGKRGDDEWNIPNITPVYLKENETPLNMVLFLNEESGYTFLGKTGDGNNRESFHTSDIYIAEKLISKLQAHYLLQWI